MARSESPWDDPSWIVYAEHAMNTLEPMIRDSAVALSLVPPGDKVDPKFAIELGYMIMLDKPIIAVVGPGSKVPLKLAQVSDEIVEGAIDDPGFQDRLVAAMDRITRKRKLAERKGGRK